MFRKIIVFLMLAFILPFAPHNVLAYDEETTHPALTQEIVEFYNLLHPNEKLTEEEKEFIVSGSIKEDEWPRWLNHFYDPVYKVGWTGEKVGNVPSFIAQTLSLGVSTEGARSAVNWVNNVSAQEQYAGYGGNRTWKKGLEYFAEGNVNEAYVTLGHALHLLEDMSVPEHTRNDTHAPLEAAGDEGSPFEDYLRRWTRESIGQLDIANGLKRKNTVTPSFSTIEEYLASLAEYSNKYFFSKDTVNDLKYEFPKIVRDDRNFGYGIDESGQEFPLVLVRNAINQNKEIIKIYSIKNKGKYYPILDAYFSRLAPKAVLYGAGVIELFKRQAAEAAINKEYPARLVKYDFSFITPKSFSLAAEGKKVFEVARNLVANISETAATAAGALGSLFKSETSLQENIRTEVPNNSVAAETAIPHNSNKNPLAAIETKSAPVVAEIRETSNVPQLNPAPVNRQVAKNQNVAAAVAATNISTNPISVSVYSAPRPPVVANETPAATSTEPAATSTPSTGSRQATTTATSTATSTDATATSTATSTEPMTTSTASLVLISEIQVAGVDSGDEFIELYNPATSSVDISDWSIQYVSGKTETVSTSTVSKKNFTVGSFIPAQGFFLIARNTDASGTDGYASNVAADMVHRTFSLSGASAGAKLFLVSDNQEITSATDADIVDFLDYSFLVPPAGQSLERKALKSDSCVSVSGMGEFFGNGCDTGTDADFEIRAVPSPQNSRSLPEPRNAPQITDFKGVWSTSTREITLNWGESTDVLGATSTVIYKLHGPSSTIIFSGTSTYRFVFSVEKTGLDYAFFLRAADREVFSGATSSLTVTATSTDLASTTPVSEWRDPLTSFDMNVGVNSPPSLGAHLMATATYPGPGQFAVGDATFNAVDKSYNNHSSCCNFFFIVLKDANGNHLANSSEAGPQFGNRVSFSNVLLVPGTVIEYYVRDLQGGSNWSFSKFTFYKAAPPPPPVPTSTERLLVYQPNDQSVAGPFSTGPRPGRIRFLFQFLGKGGLKARQLPRSK